MNIAAIGIGGAGGRVVDLLAAEHGTGDHSSLAAVHAIDTDTESLQRLDAVPQAARHGIGQFETGGDGTDGDRTLAGEIIEAEKTELRRAVEDGIATTVDAIVLVAGLAGGTGGAATPPLAAGLRRVYEQPVYTVSILPASTATDETSEETGRVNTAHALSGLEEHATAQIVFDNDVWLREGQRIESQRESLNRELVERFGELLQLGEKTGGDVGERVVDSRDVQGTLDGGGIVTLGYASREISEWRESSFAVADRLKRRLFGDDTDEFERGNAVQRTLNWATSGTLTFECPRDAGTHALVVFRGPPEWLRGDAIASGREWFTDRTGVAELRSGDIPVSNARSLDVFIVLAGIENTPRIDEFRE